MNVIHRWFCKSARWKTAVERYIVPWVLEDVDLGSNVVEVGPGPGITTDLLRTRVEHLTCVEIDRALADTLARRMAGTNVSVVCEDATAMTLPDAAFDSAVSFTMLHHVGSAELQDRLLCEVHRVLRPGGLFAGTDSLPSPLFRLMHLFDTMIIVDPAGLPDRLAAAGFTEIAVDVMQPYAFRFRARRSS